MTLVLVWQHNDEVVVIADTLFGARGRTALEVGPKIFAIPVRVSCLGSEKPPHACPDFGFAFAGHTASGQVTHALASAGTLNLFANQVEACPAVADVAAYYGRCAAYVVNEMLRFHQTPDYLFEGIVFGYENGGGVVYSLDVKIELGVAHTEIVRLDLTKYGLFAIGQGHEKVQNHIDTAWAGGKKSTLYEALQAVIEDDDTHSVGGAIQAAIAQKGGVELKPVLQVDVSGRARGGFMGADSSLLGMVGQFSPMSISPIILPPTD
jgi:hypothetical protein